MPTFKDGVDTAASCMAFMLGWFSAPVVLLWRTLPKLPEPWVNEELLEDARIQIARLEHELDAVEKREQRAVDDNVALLLKLKNIRKEIAR